jgi:hypothetical protein
MTLSKVRFRLFSMPCCGHALCWVNPRLPNYCPECGKSTFAQLKLSIPLEDFPAEIRADEVEITDE